jgi:serine/threonine protein kinase
LFDFGLAREVPKPVVPVEEDCSSRSLGYEDPDKAHIKQKYYVYSDVWKMTGETGTPRYMAPEVALNQPYNGASDTYSFMILLWELLALKTPFEMYTSKAVREKVWKHPHKRPPIDKVAWPQTLKLLMQKGWSHELDGKSYCAFFCWKSLNRFGLG